MNMIKRIINRGIQFLSILIVTGAAVGCEILDFDAYKTPEILVISPSEKTPNALQRNIQVSVICDIKWKAEVSEDWGTIENLVIGKDNKGSFTLTLAPNTGKDSRELDIVVKAGKSSRSYPITQQGMDTFFNPSPVVLAGTNESKVSFKSPCDWTAEVASGKDWLVLNTAKGHAGDASLSCVASDPNENIGSREGSIRLTFETVVVELPVVQGQKDVILSEDSQASFDWQGGEFSVHTRTNVQYAIECSASWVKHSVTKALNEATETFTVEPNSDSAERTATIRFTGGDGSLTVTVIQSGRDPFLFITTPGFYGIAGMDYVLGSNGWNQSGRKALTDGSLDLRLMNQSSMSVISVTGIKKNLTTGSTANVSVVMKTGFKETLRSSFSTTVIDSNDELMWLKAEPATCFIVKK